jgi:hypothetical protein
MEELQMLYKDVLNRIAKLVKEGEDQIAPSSKCLQLQEGIGSSGAEVALICKDKLAAAGVDEGVWVSAIETSPRLKDRFGSDGQFLILNQFPAHDFLEDWAAHPDKYPGLDQHLTDPTQSRLSLGATDDINEGAQGARDLGILLLYFYQLRRGSELHSFLQHGVRALKMFASKSPDGRFSGGGSP